MVSDLEIFTNKGYKINEQNKVCFGRILAYWAEFLGISATIHIGWDSLSPVRMRDFLLKKSRLIHNRKHYKLDR